LAPSASDGTQLNPKKPAVERLLSEETAEIAEATEELIETRKQLIRQLIELIENEQNRQLRHPCVRSAIYILGEMRALEAIDVLVEHIRYPEGIVVDGLIIDVGPALLRGGGVSGIERICPAVPALIKIGHPCLGKVMTKLYSTEPSYEVDGCLAVLIGLRGIQAVKGDLNTRLDKETDQKKRERLETAIKRLLEEEQAQKMRRAGKR
jgi:hypothetical protein